jgi:CII-binding regulator of phage lambda lysogenization HflD
MAELRLKFAQTLSGEPDFLDQDYLNVGLYILSLRFNRYKAALLVLKRQLSVEKEKRLIDWLKNRIQRIEKKIQQPDLDYELEFKNLKKCFSN